MMIAYRDKKRTQLKTLLCAMCLAVIAVMTVGCASSAPKNVRCTINSHIDGDTVERYTTLEGTADGMQPKWRIYAYTRAMSPGAPWWLSDKNATFVADEWSVDLVVGNEETPDDTQFESIVVISNGTPPANSEEIPDSVLQCAKIKLVRR